MLNARLRGCASPQSFSAAKHRTPPEESLALLLIGLRDLPSTSFYAARFAMCSEESLEVLRMFVLQSEL